MKVCAFAPHAANLSDWKLGVRQQNRSADSVERLAPRPVFCKNSFVSSDVLEYVRLKCPQRRASVHSFSDECEGINNNMLALDGFWWIYGKD